MSFFPFFFLFPPPPQHVFFFFLSPPPPSRRFVLQVRTWQAPHHWLLPSSCGCVGLGAGNQSLGRSLPLSGCLTCPGLGAIVISYSSGGGEGRKRVCFTQPLAILAFAPLSELRLVLSIEKGMDGFWRVKGKKLLSRQPMLSELTHCMQGILSW